MWIGQNAVIFPGVQIGDGVLGDHIHYDTYISLVEGSTEVTIEKVK